MCYCQEKGHNNSYSGRIRSKAKSKQEGKGGCPSTLMSPPVFVWIFRCAASASASASASAFVFAFAPASAFASASALEHEQEKIHRKEARFSFCVSLCVTCLSCALSLALSLSHSLSCCSFINDTHSRRTEKEKARKEATNKQRSKILFVCVSVSLCCKRRFLFVDLIAPKCPCSFRSSFLSMLATCKGTSKSQACRPPNDKLVEVVQPAQQVANT